MFERLNLEKVGHEHNRHVRGLTALRHSIQLAHLTCPFSHSHPETLPGPNYDQRSRTFPMGTRQISTLRVTQIGRLRAPSKMNVHLSQLIDYIQPAGAWRVAEWRNFESILRVPICQIRLI